MTEHFSLGLIGYPLAHSISPALHRAALQAAGLQGDYHLFEVPPLPEGEAALADLLGSLQRGELQGLNITIPHKQNLFSLLDDITPAAHKIGAVNVIFCQEGKSYGDNTDAAGFFGDLQRFLSRENRLTQPGQALVLGAGGSARAVVYALNAAGWTVTISARRIEQAQALADAIDPGQINAINLDTASLRSISKVDLVVNTTPLGMHPHTTVSPWPEDIPLPQGAAVYDLVYNPSQTNLIQAARSSGLPASSGLRMLVEQAALSFERWTGRPASRQAMLQAAHSALITKGAA
jgi:shikimate dehydrogenase